MSQIIDDLLSKINLNIDSNAQVLEWIEEA